MNPIIWNNFTDKEILSWHENVIKSFNDYETEVWFKYIDRSINKQEKLIIQ